ncbi:MAG: hypothetical protein SGARI_002537 [Bacillariaceae sp.]
MRNKEAVDFESSSIVSVLLAQCAGVVDEDERERRLCDTLMLVMEQRRKIADEGGTAARLFYRRLWKTQKEVERWEKSIHRLKFLAEGSIDEQYVQMEDQFLWTPLNRQMHTMLSSELPIFGKSGVISAIQKSLGSFSTIPKFKTVVLTNNGMTGLGTDLMKFFLPFAVKPETSPANFRYNSYQINSLVFQTKVGPIQFDVWATDHPGEFDESVADSFAGYHHPDFVKDCNCVIFSDFEPKEIPSMLINANIPENAVIMITNADTDVFRDEDEVGAAELERDRIWFEEYVKQPNFLVCDTQGTFEPLTFTVEYFTELYSRVFLLLARKLTNRPTLELVPRSGFDAASAVEAKVRELGTTKDLKFSIETTAT